MSLKMMAVMPVPAPPLEAVPSLEVRGMAAEDVLEVGSFEVEGLGG